MSLIDRVKGGNVTSQNVKIPQARKVKDMVAKARYILAKGRNVVAEKMIPRSKDTRCTSILGLNRLDRNTEINPKLLEDPQQEGIIKRKVDLDP